ncbi:MAG: bifunctional hydroxymethylpyrimidine kinase/phosphomethylpyrimidine kinase [Sphingomonadaceae bacterium]|nr:bifunctional hydroxymethylpyrimidine kinase/phosphomethylpyrimidine kinase [Sphingomonadaceae bacterium]
MTIPRILAIAGSDSGGGAGIQADIKTITLLGGHAMTAITAVTAQNTLGVERVDTMSTKSVLAQIDAVAKDIGIDAVKIGMIGSAETALAVAERVKAIGAPIVFDPVMIATSGSALADEETIEAFHALMRVATLVTPNLPELARLTWSQPASAYQMEREARRLSRDFKCAVLAKGAHLDDALIHDILIEKDGRAHRWRAKRIDTRHTHGTGCTLSSAIATLLGKGLPLEKAIAEAREFVRAALLAAPGFGSGHGPMGHYAVR